MAIEALEKLTNSGLLKHEPPGREEIAGLIPRPQFG